MLKRKTKCYSKS